MSTPGIAQTITSTQQKALNGYVAYANQSTQEVNAVVRSIMDYYPDLHRKGYSNPRYVCPVQMEDYYFNNALQESKSLVVTHSSPLNEKLKALRDAAARIEEKCRALDTYHKLEDYKRDNFAKAELIITELQLLLNEYLQKQIALSVQLESSYRKLNAYVESNPYHKVDKIMRKAISDERDFLNSWTFNLKEEIHTGWPADKLEKSISASDAQLKALSTYNPPLKYPASSMYPSLKEALGSILDIKRSGLDGYNVEAKKSDKHSNDVYLSLINYFNGALVSDYNAFIDFAQTDNYLGLKAIQYISRYEIRTQEKIIKVDVKPFADTPHAAIVMTNQKTGISKKAFQSLNQYIDFVNEAWRQTRNLAATISSFNSSASYYKDLTSFAGRGGLRYDFKDYQVPLSAFQQTISASSALPSAASKSLNEQTEVILNILKELDQLSASLEKETTSKNYEKDNLKRIYEIMERQKLLFDIWDERKEQLCNDVRKVFDAYPPISPTNSWYISSKALQKLVDADHIALLQAKAFYKGNGEGNISTTTIDQLLHEVIANEYSNMKGIEKIGRNNGLCPYTPYEDLPETSKSFSEKLTKLKPISSTSSQSVYGHPYHELVYHYNDIVDDLNKFSSLSKDVFVLMTVKQPEFFDVQYPKKKETETKPSDVVVPIPVTTKPIVQENPPTAPVTTKPTSTTSIVHDTVYIEKRDTIYVGEPGESLRSMEGYAINNMVLLLDVSGSMNVPEKLPLLKQSVLNMLSMMRQEDKVSIVVYSGKAKVLLPPTSFKDEEKIKKVINELTSSGKTDGNAGLKLAYKVADENYLRGGNNRIILATDGEFPVSEEIRESIEKFSKEDIFLTVFNFGKQNNASQNLKKLSDLGKGNYTYINKTNAELTLIREAKSKRSK
ncbi:MAG: VWA domain-containing protein [Chryseolinea sp.]